LWKALLTPKIEVSEPVSERHPNLTFIDNNFYFSKGTGVMKKSLVLGLVFSLLSFHQENTEGRQLEVSSPQLKVHILGPSTVEIQFENPNHPTPGDWIGIYSPDSRDSSWIAWVYTSSCTIAPGNLTKSEGSCKFTVPKTGVYEFRLFSDNKYTVLATSSNVKKRER